MGIEPASKTENEAQGPLTFGEAWKLYSEKWLPTLAKARTEEARYEYHIAPRFADTPLDKIKPLDLEDFKGELTNKGLAPKTVMHVLCLVRSVFNKMAEWELYDGRVPTTKMKMPKVDNARIRYLTPAEASDLMASLKEEDITWWQMASLSLNAGLRLGEILDLAWSDLDLDAGVMHIRDGKEGSRMAYINDTLKTIFQSMIPGRKSDPVFMVTMDTGRSPVSVTKVFPKVVNELGLNTNVTDRRQRVVFHSLRHTFASWLAIKGVPLYTIATLMGHSTIEMTKRYAHLCPDTHRQAIGEIDAINNQASSTAAGSSTKTRRRSK
jgi:integrase